MDSKSPKSTAVQEYVLYGVIIMLAVLIAMLFRISSAIPMFAGLNIYFGLAFIGGLASAFYRLNKLHRERKTKPAAPKLEPKIEIPEPPAIIEVTQIAEPSPIAAPTTKSEGQLILGLTTAQLLIILVVFVGALAAFSWSFASMHLGAGN